MKQRTEKTRSKSRSVKRKQISATDDDPTQDLLLELKSLLKTLGIESNFQYSKIKQRREATSAALRTRPYTASIAEILSYWHRDPAYLDNTGNPKPLRKTGRTNSFQSLARKAAPEYSMDEILLLLRKTGSVSLDDSGYIRAIKRSLPVFGKRDLAHHHTLLALRGFVKTLAHNLESEPLNSKQLFHRIAWNGEFDGNETARLKVWIKKNGQGFLESIDDWMKGRSIREKASSDKLSDSVQASIGIYLAVEPKKENELTQ